MKQNLTSFFRPQSQSAAAEAVKILILKKKLFIQVVFKGPKNHTRAVKFLFIIKNKANFDLILKIIANIF